MPEPHLTDYLKVLHKRRWTAATAFLLVLAGVTVYTFTATPIFEARTRLLIEAENPNVVTFKEVIDEDQAKADYYQTQYNILQSRALARKTIESLGLWDHPLLNRDAARARGFSVTRAIGGAFGLVTGLFSSAPAAAAADAAAAGEETEAQSRAIDTLLAKLTVSPIRNSRLVDVKFRSPDAALSTRVVNALAKNYIDQNLEYKFSASKEANDWLDDPARRAAQGSRGRRGEAPGVSRKERRHLARRSPEHRRPEADRPQRRGDEGEDGTDPEGGDVQAAARHREQSRRRSTPSRRSWATASSSSRRPSSRSSSSSTRSCRRSSARSIRRSSRPARRSRTPS